MANGPPLIALKDAGLALGGPPLFQHLDLGLQRGERACLVGRNGSGKSSLIRVLAGRVGLDSGERFLQPGSIVGHLPQDPASEDPDFKPEATAIDYAAGGLRKEQADEGYRAEALLEELGLTGDRLLGTLSGGEARRASLARALVGAPDVLLLDEPTNHLDLPAIEALEERLLAFRGALLLISHDRAFLNRLARRSYWLDRGELRLVDRPFSEFNDWLDEWLEREEAARHRLDRKIVREERWLQRGVTARRKRNQGRLTRLQGLRQTRRDWLDAPGQAKLGLERGESGGDLVLEAKNLCKSFEISATDKDETDGRCIVQDFSTRILRGERIGIIGPNGAGKTTLARLLIGDLKPDSGRLRIARTVQTLYFDQTRESLNPQATLWQTLAPDGGDSIMVRGRQRHVVSYLRDYLFAESQVRQPVASLSGGEKNRLLLAQLFAQPGDLVVLDEPTNDLDLETLDLLEEALGGFDGTLLMVSHDRDFLDRLVNGIIVMEGDGKARDFAGGYSDYLRHKGREAAPVEKAKPAKRQAPASTRAAGPAPMRKLSYKDQRELGLLPAEIERLTNEAESLEAKLAEPDFYQRDPAGFEAAGRRLGDSRADLAAKEERWLELAELKERLAREPAKS